MKNKTIPGTMQESADVDKKRLESLSWIQSKLLQHALTFPNVKRVTYSTCSIAKEENEMVGLRRACRRHDKTFCSVSGRGKGIVCSRCVLAVPSEEMSSSVGATRSSGLCIQ